MPKRVSRRGWLLGIIGAPLVRSFGAQAMSAVIDGDSLLVLAPDFHFLNGKSLRRLKDGASVLFLSQLGISLDNNITFIRRVPDRFVVSYDLWEEKFSVTKMGTLPRSVSHLSAPAVERWCIQSLSINAAGITPDKPFWMRLDLRAADPREQAGVVGESGINLTRLIEIFSRPPGGTQPHWTLEAGPLRLADLKKADARGPRNG